MTLPKILSKQKIFYILIIEVSNNLHCCLKRSREEIASGKVAARTHFIIHLENQYVRSLCAAIAMVKNGGFFHIVLLTLRVNKYFQFLKIFIDTVIPADIKFSKSEIFNARHG